MEEEMSTLSINEKEQDNNCKSSHNMEWLEDKTEFNRWKNTYNVEEGPDARGEPIKKLVRIGEDTSNFELWLVDPMLDIFDIIHQSHIIT